MIDEPFGEGGAANTPPFPRSAQGDPLREASLGRAEAPDPAKADPLGEAWADEPFESPEGGSTAGADPVAEAESRRDRGGSVGAAARAGAELLKRLERTLYHGLGNLADQFEDAASRIDHLADERLHALGPKGERAAGAAESAAGWLHGSAEYLRSSELRDLQRDLERQVRERPLQSLLVSAGAGWLLGKIVR